MQQTITKFLILTIALTFALSVNYIFAAWTGPTQAPPGGNTPMPVHVGSINQVKDGGLSLDALSVFGGGYFQGNVGVGVVTPTEKLDVTGNIKASGTVCDSNGCIGDGDGGFSFGNWETKGINTVYQAATDGFVVASNKPPTGVLYGYTDGSNPPTTLRNANDAWGDIEGIMFPVKSGDYWRVYQPTPSSSSNDVYWLPIISGGGIVGAGLGWVDVTSDTDSFNTACEYKFKCTSAAGWCNSSDAFYATVVKSNKIITAWAQNETAYVSSGNKSITSTPPDGYGNASINTYERCD